MKIDLTDQTFGRLTAKETVGKDKRGYLWRCACECGGEKIVPASYLRKHHTTSCGCIAKNKRDQSIKKGDRWGLLEAVQFVGYETMPSGKRHAVWKFKCDCGNEKIMAVSNVKFGNVRSCGHKVIEHIANLKRKDITGETYHRLTALRPTEERADNGSVVWEFLCECGNITKMSVFRFHTGRVHSCGCLYNESRKDCTSHRKDFVDSTCLSSIVSAKTSRANNTSGHTGVYLDKKSGKWQAYLNYKKKRYYLGYFKEKDDAIRARKKGEERIHDPAIIEHFQNLTPERKTEFIEYLKSNGSAIELGNIEDQK